MWTTLALWMSLGWSIAAPPAEPPASSSPSTERWPSMPLSPVSPSSLEATPAPTPAPTVAPKRTTPLMASFAGRLVARASTTWPGWGPERLLDGDAQTSWFSARGDAAAFGKKPWVEVGFPVDVDVKRVLLLGNREPAWATGFTIQYGLLELFAADGRPLQAVKNEGKNRLADVDFVLKTPVRGVRTVRFTSLLDEGNQTQFEDIALAEILVE
jgi:hypothetical protein